MGFADFFKAKGRRVSDIDNRGIEIPPAPPKKEELPTFPSPDDVPEFRGFAKKKNIVEQEEDFAVKSQKEELEERDGLKVKRPIFVYLDQYKEMIAEMGLIQSTLKEGDDSLTRISEFKEDSEKEYKKWESCIKDMQRKLIFVDKTLF